ncbi:NDP-hexose 2,3-dehydratase family protein [Streptomyces sp. GMR22]|uniref:NDP-hexose 2,3-dehydratase family protein n=1 Tax=Streptomyces sp. GMR22 TaxID=2759524 RepID=UPI0015FE5F82|nr:NDP-hexose 2,3-dehydratase family protein [Streptomyces sp. GMR22]MBA6437033.1 NDP-hexose 2,3-dehydratase family protein [Streptomyces sp. GMR22]
MPSRSPLLRSRQETGLPARLTRSAARAARGVQMATAEVGAWLAERRSAHHFCVHRIPFDRLEKWSFEEGTGNLVHRSGRFFTVEGLHVTEVEGPFPDWQQPVINQPEVGILGILVKEFDGVLHFLMQAKMEPGNPNLLQLSPTVQATRSNYTKAHRGADVKYLEYFTRPGRGRMHVDVLQSEHGAWFVRKANRNMLVETTDEVPPDNDFCWLTLGQLGRLLREDNVVNMDARTVLGCLPSADSETVALHSDTELLSWITAERARHEVYTRRIPLAEVEGWHQDAYSVHRADGRYFSVVAVAVEAGNREVTGWTQPLFEPHGLGVIAFLTRRIEGVPHLLVHARVEGGFLDTIELAPTVQCVPQNYPRPGDCPKFLDLVLAAGSDRIRYEARHSEEGGRFLNAQSRTLIVEADEEQAPLEPPSGYRWVTPAQLSTLTRHAHYVNVQARTLLACLHSGAAHC